MKSLVLCLYVLLSALIVPQQLNESDWETKFEKSGYLETSRYVETMDYFSRIDDNSPFAKMFSFGVSPHGRNLNCIVVSKDKAFTPEEAKKTGKPVILVINGIHSGEIEGKDASMILLREILITKEKEKLIDNVILLIVPIFSVDGHERFRKFNRINQNGPVEMGWRTTAQNLNLNRDWMKADAPEMQSMLKLFSDWLPDFMIDTHTTDGADYQYTITYGIDKYKNTYSETAEMIRKQFLPYFKENVEKAGFLVAPYVSFRDWSVGFESGLSEGVAGPRFSHSYAAAQNRPGLLIETHMMKPYKDRVFATKEALETVINFCSEYSDNIIDLNKRADERAIKKYSVDEEYYPLAFLLSEKFVTEKFKGKTFYKTNSGISGKEKIIYTGRDTVFDVQVYRDPRVIDSVKAPAFYLIPQEWKEIVERMELHGIIAEQLKNEEEFEVTRYKFINVKFDSASLEGRHRVNFETESFNEKVKTPAGTYIVNTNQRTVGIIIYLLEPKSQDSFVKWGFFNSVFEMKEYYEDYVMEKVAEEMLDENPELKKEFERKLQESEDFRNDPDARLLFFYECSPYFDENYRVYPVMRVE